MQRKVKKADVRPKMTKKGKQSGKNSYADHSRRSRRAKETGAKTTSDYANC